VGDLVCLIDLQELDGNDAVRRAIDL
jgi:hypothetical protein